jgi:hypothetical protein
VFIGCFVKVSADYDIVVECLVDLDRLDQVDDERLTWVKVRSILLI